MKANTATHKRVPVSLNFMPAFFTRHTGVTYGEAYYFDPQHRARVAQAEGKFLYEVLGRYGVGSPDPQPPANLFIQPVDVIMRTQGAEWRFPADGTVESWGKPWAGLSAAQIAGVDARAAAHHPAIDAIVQQYAVLQRICGDRADVFGAKSGLMNIHTPYTTAHQLCGEDIFVLMMEDPAAATAVFEKVWEIYRAIFQRIQEATSAKFTRIQMGDCAAAMLSDDLYRRVVLPMNLKIVGGFERAGYHSCGASTHLLGAFARIAKTDWLELGPGTDLAAASATLPGRRIGALVDPNMMRSGDEQAVRQAVGKIIADTAAAPELVLCAWSFDRDTPLENVKALYETAGHKGT